MNPEAEHLIDRFLDGTASQEERAQLARMLTSDPDVMDLYTDRVRLHTLLREIHTEEADLPSPFPDVSHDPVEQGLAWYAKPLAAGIVLCCAALVSILVYMHISDHDRPENAQRIHESGAVLVRDGMSLDLTEGMRLKPGDTVRTGTDTGSEGIGAEIRGSAFLSMSAHSEIAVAERTILRMQHGTVRFTVIPQQENFTVHIVPLKAAVRVKGTEFIIECIEKKGTQMKKTVVTAALITVLSGTVGVTPSGGEEVAAQTGMTLQVTERGIVTEQSAEQKNIRKKLSQKISFTFEDMPLTEAVSHFQKMSGLNIILDSRALKGKKAEDISIVFRAADMTLEHVLFWTARKAGLVCAIEDTTVIISSKKLYPHHWPLHQKGEEQTGWHRNIREKLKTKISFDFVNTPFTEKAASFLQSLTGITIITDYGIDPHNNRVTLRVNDMPVETALKWICRMSGFEFTVAREALLVSAEDSIADDSDRKKKAREAAQKRRKDEKKKTKEDVRNNNVRRLLEKPVSFNVADIDMSALQLAVQEMAGISVVVAPEVPMKKVTLNADSVPVKTLLDKITGQIPGTAWTIKGEAVFIYNKEKSANSKKRFSQRKRQTEPTGR